MPPLVTLDQVSLAYGTRPLLDHVDLQIDPGEKVCLIGRNGEGKSTLLRLIAGEAQADDGRLWRQDGVTVAYLPQDVEADPAQTVFETVIEGLGPLAGKLNAYHEAARRLSEGEDTADELERLQHELEAADGWRLEQRVETALSRFQLAADDRLGALSGGQQRRVLLARALVDEPDLLLLDEPTNHLDIDAIAWLEEFLLNYPGALLFITHDRAFLRRLAGRIVELDRGQLTSWPGDYDRYLERKAHALEVEAEQAARFDKKLAQEEAWIRQGIKARRTRNEGRVRALQQMRKERAQRRERQGQVRMELDSGERSGKLVVEVEDAAAGYGDTPLFEHFSTRVLRGDRIGIIGPNGVGKSTLLKLLLGEIEPLAGRVRMGTNLEVAYFDQQRAQLDPEATVLDNLNLGKDTVTVGGRERHVMSYLQDFLFPPERIRSPVRSLSGGERNRLLLARLFTRPANLLVLDEPTNDLDVETLELLEELLLDYDGTLFLVSHDRAFLDNVVTSTLAFDEPGRVNEYVGGYSDWQRQRRASGPSGAAAPAKEEKAGSKPKPAPAKKLGYKEQRELDALPERIEGLEAELETVQNAMSDPGFYQDDAATIAATTARMQELEAELAAAYERWDELEAKRS